MNKYIVLMKITILVLLIVLTINVLPVNSITKRNDEYIPSEIARIDNNYIIQKLSELKKLNDTVVNNYVEQITQLLNNGEYDKAYELLSELNRYVEEKYDGNIKDEDLAQSISILQSIKDINNEGTYINLTQYLETLSDLLNDPELLKYAEELRSGEIPDTKYIKDVMSYIKSFEETPQTTKSKALTPYGEENITNENINIFNPSTLSMPENKFGNVFSLPQITMPSLIINTNTLLFIITAIVVLTVLYYYKDKLAVILTPLRRRILYGINQVRTAIKYGKQDPVIELYMNWYNLVKAMGYKREPFETLREFLVKITDKSLVSKGEIVTELYEKKIYGKTSINEELIEKVKKEIRELTSFMAMRK